jgi:hypothetical protein
MPEDLRIFDNEDKLTLDELKARKTMLDGEIAKVKLTINEKEAENARALGITADNVLDLNKLVPEMGITKQDIIRENKNVIDASPFVIWNNRIYKTKDFLEGNDRSICFAYQIGL